MGDLWCLPRVSEIICHSAAADFAKMRWPAQSDHDNGHKKQFREQSASFAKHLWKPQPFHKLHSPQLSWALRLRVFYCLSPPGCSLPGKTITGKSPNHKPTNWCQTKDVTVSISHGFWQVLLGEEQPGC